MKKLINSLKAARKAIQEIADSEKPPTHLFYEGKVYKIKDLSKKRPKKNLPIPGVLNEDQYKCECGKWHKKGQ